MYTTRMFSRMEEILLGYIETLSLETFVFVASIVEEVIAPIPSPTIMMMSGSMAQVQEYAVWGLLPLAVIGALGKTVGALVVYFIANKAERILLGTFGKFFNVTSEDVQKLGSSLGKGYKDYMLLTFLRALPIMPSVILSVGSGILKIPLPLFIFSTFVGTIVRDGFYLYAGYVGTTLFLNIVSQSSVWETYVQVLIVLSFVGLLVYLRYGRKKGDVTPV